MTQTGGKSLLSALDIPQVMAAQCFDGWSATSRVSVHLKILTDSHVRARKSFITLLLSGVPSVLKECSRLVRFTMVWCTSSSLVYVIFPPLRDRALLTTETSQPVVTVLVYLVYRRYPNSWVKYINVPVFFNAAGKSFFFTGLGLRYWPSLSGNIPPANTSKSELEETQLGPSWTLSLAQYSLWFIFGFIFNYLIRKRAFAWWKRYNCKLAQLNISFLFCRQNLYDLPSLDLTQAAMDTGTALATIIIFFALSYNGIKLNWWGNNVGSDTDDAKGTPWLTVPRGSHFGKGPGEF